jgi:hypothetical protein
LVLPLGKGAYRFGVPVEFLSDREVTGYGRYTEAPSPGRNWTGGSFWTTPIRRWSGVAEVIIIGSGSPCN